MLYIVIFIVLSYLAYIFIYKSSTISFSRKNNAYCLFVVFLFLIYYLLKQNSLFPDIDDYYYLYKRISETSWPKILSEGSPIKGLEYSYGWCVFNKLLASVSHNPYFLIFAESVVLTISYTVFIKRYSSMPALSVVLVMLSIFYFSCFLLRQSLAVAICLWSIPCVLKKRPLKFLIYIIVAFSIHKTSLVFVLLYPLYYMRVGSKFFYFFIVGLNVVLFIARDFLIDFAISMIGISSAYYEISDANGGAASYMTFIINLLTLLFVLFFNRVKQLEGIEKLMFDALILTTVITLFGAGMDGTIAGRLPMYFIPCYAIIIPDTCMKIKSGPSRDIVVIGLVTCFFIWMMKGFNYGFSF